MQDPTNGPWHALIPQEERPQDDSASLQQNFPSDVPGRGTPPAVQVISSGALTLLQLLETVSLSTCAWDRKRRSTTLYSFGCRGRGCVVLILSSSGAGLAWSELPPETDYAHPPQPDLEASAVTLYLAAPAPASQAGQS